VARFGYIVKKECCKVGFYNKEGILQNYFNIDNKCFRMLFQSENGLL